MFTHDSFRVQLQTRLAYLLLVKTGASGLHRVSQPFSRLSSPPAQGQNIVNPNTVQMASAGHRGSAVNTQLMLSQNHRMFGAGRDLCGSPSPTPCQSRVTQSRLHSTASRLGWNISREGDSTTSLGSLGQP